MAATPLVPLTQVLAGEHRLIQRSVVLLARYCARIRRTGEVDPALARQFVRFFRVYYDHHMRREERLLFPWVRRRGDERSSEAVAVLLAEHRETREIVVALETIVEALARDPRDPEPGTCFCATAERLARLLSEHDWKEDHLLYPLADYLDAATRDLLAEVPDGYSSCVKDPQEFSRWAEDVEALAFDWPREEVDLHALPHGMDDPRSIGSGAGVRADHPEQDPT